MRKLKLTLSLIMLSGAVLWTGVPRAQIMQQGIVASAAPAEPTFTDIQGAWGTVQSSGTTLSVTLSSNPTAGNAIMCSIYLWPQSLTISSMVDNASSPNSYTVTPNSPATSSGSIQMEIQAYLLNVPSGAGKTITATTSAAITFNSKLGCEEFHRDSGTWTFDTDVKNTSGSGQTVTTPSITPSVTGELLFGSFYPSVNVCGTGGTGAGSPWTGGTLHDNCSSSAAVATIILASPSGTTAMNWNMTSGAGGTWNAMITALK